MKFRPRFRLRVLLALPVVGAVAMWAAVELAPTYPATGRVSVEVTVRAVEAESGEPIVGASVRMIDPMNADFTGPGSRSMIPAPTVRDGVASLSIEVTRSGIRSWFRGSMTDDFGFRWLEVSAPGRVALVAPLSDYTGERRASDDPPPTATVRLAKGPTPAVDLGEFAGDYRRAWQNLTVGADGRYFGFENSVDGEDKRYGFARAEGDRLIFEPVDRRNEVPRSEWASRFPPRAYRRVAWSGRVYLIAEDESRDFCNYVNLIGAGRFSSVTPYFYVRKGDDKKPIVGLPDVPDGWRKYLLPKPIRGTVVRVFEGENAATVDLGRDDGILEGMRLSLVDLGLMVDVVAVDESTCRVVLRDRQWKPALGMKIGSRFEPSD